MLSFVCLQHACAHLACLETETFACVDDVTDPHSLDNLDHWRKEFVEQVGGGAAALSDAATQFPFVVLGNKVDKTKDRLVPPNRAEDWCREAAGAYTMGSRPLQHFETSAKTAINVDEAFHELARLALQYEDFKRRTQPQLFVPPKTDPIDLRHQTSSTVSQDGGCC